MTVYKKPKKRAHKGFFYLNDEVVINSLSALESGKVDEIVSKTVVAREGGFSGELKGGVTGIGASLGGGKKATSEVEEEMVRTVPDSQYSMRGMPSFSKKTLLVPLRGGALRLWQGFQLATRWR